VRHLVCTMCSDGGPGGDDAATTAARAVAERARAYQRWRRAESKTAGEHAASSWNTTAAREMRVQASDRDMWSQAARRGCITGVCGQEQSTTWSAELVVSLAVSGASAASVHMFAGGGESAPERPGKRMAQYAQAVLAASAAARVAKASTGDDEEAEEKVESAALAGQAAAADKSDHDGRRIAACVSAMGESASASIGCWGWEGGCCLG
jgi:hypothetical protein